MPLDRFAAWLKKRLEKKLHDWKKFVLHLCKLETCIYISLAAMYGLTTIDNILVAGWKHASFLCYSMGALIFTFSGTQVRIAEIERLQSLLKTSMVNTQRLYTNLHVSAELR